MKGKELNAERMSDYKRKEDIENDQKERDEQKKKTSKSHNYTKYTKHPFPPLLGLEPKPIVSQS